MVTAAQTTDHQVGEADQRSVPPPDLLRPPPEGGLASFPAARTHPAASTLAVAAGCYVLLATILIGSGLAFTHLLAHSRIGHWDDHVNSWFVLHRSPGWNRISGDFTFLADTLGIAVVAAAVTLVLLARHWGKRALLLLFGLGFELAVFLSTTYLVARPRPAVPHLGSTPSTFSWPSGHTAATVVLYGGIALLIMVATPNHVLRTVAWVVAVALVVGVGLARIYRGEHHPTDTMAGVALGIGALTAAVTVIRMWSAGTTARPATSQPVPHSELAPR